MRLVLSVSLFLFTVAVSTAQQTNAVCRTIEITGPSRVANPGDTLTFAVTLSSTPADVRYVWKVSRGVIEDGQGTQSIIVRTSLEDHGQNVEATISIEGFPSGCDGTATATGQVASMLPWESWDEWGRMPDNDQRGRLDIFFRKLENNPDHFGLFYISTETQDGPRAPQRRIAFILNHARLRKFDKKRFIFALTGVDDHKIRLYQYRPGQYWEIDCKPPCRLIYGRDLK